jgi:hypothetical protein
VEAAKYSRWIFNKYSLGYINTCYICGLGVKKYVYGCVVTWNTWVYSNQGRGTASSLQLVKQSIIMFIQHLCTVTGLWINAGRVSLTATSVATTGIKFCSTANRPFPNSGLCKPRPQDRRWTEFLSRIQDVWRSNLDPEPPCCCGRRIPDITQSLPTNISN